MTLSAWTDRTPSRRCDWLDLIRGWAVIVMIEVHCVNVWLPAESIPGWLQYLNGLVAPSFIMAAGYSLALSTFRPDGGIRPFGPTFRRLGFILACAYLLHAPGLNLADWTLLGTAQKYREIFKIDVLQCIVFSLLILHALARTLRRPRAYAVAALAAALAVALASPRLWLPGVADGWWLPIRGLVNGNPDRGVTALFPLAPWFAFAAFGSVLGAVYRELRVLPAAAGGPGPARWSEARWLLALGALGAALALWGTLAAPGWLQGSGWPRDLLDRLHNTTLPSIAQRLGVVCLAGAALGALEQVRPRWPGTNPVKAASSESLLMYMLHLELIFGLLLAKPVRAALGLEWHSLGWTATLAITFLLIALNLWAAVQWQAVRLDPDRARRLQRLGALALAAWFVLAGLVAFGYYRIYPDKLQRALAARVRVVQAAWPGSC
jgi:uncharacterized membrane protein